MHCLKIKYVTIDMYNMSATTWIVYTNKKDTGIKKPANIYLQEVYVFLEHNEELSIY